MSRLTKLVTKLLVFAIAFAIAAQGARVKQHPDSTLVSGLPTCDATWDGRIVTVTDAASATDCATGAGSDVALCICDSGAGWGAVISDAPSDHGALTGLGDNDHTQYSVKPANTITVCSSGCDYTVVKTAVEAAVAASRADSAAAWSVKVYPGEYTEAALSIASGTDYRVAVSGTESCTARSAQWIAKVCATYIKKNTSTAGDFWTIDGSSGSWFWLSNLSLGTNTANVGGATTALLLESDGPVSISRITIHNGSYGTGGNHIALETGTGTGYPVIENSRLTSGWYSYTASKNYGIWVGANGGLAGYDLDVVAGSSASGSTGIYLASSASRFACHSCSWGEYTNFLPTYDWTTTINNAGGTADCYLQDGAYPPVVSGACSVLEDATPDLPGKVAGTADNGAAIPVQAGALPTCNSAYGVGLTVDQTGDLCLCDGSAWSLVSGVGSCA